MAAAYENPTTRAALDFAAERHAKQTRKDGQTPYIRHPARVGEWLYNAGLRDSTVIAAAVLHDVIEDTPTQLVELQDRFGDDVASLVAELTKTYESGSKGQGRRTFMDGYRHADPRSCLIKMADRLDNLRDWGGMDPGYRATYAVEGLRILTACLDNQRRHPSILGFKMAWDTTARALMAECNHALFPPVR